MAGGRLLKPNLTAKDGPQNDKASGRVDFFAEVGHERNRNETQVLLLLFLARAGGPATDRRAAAAARTWLDQLETLYGARCRARAAWERN